MKGLHETTSWHINGSPTHDLSSPLRNHTHAHVTSMYSTHCVLRECVKSLSLVAEMKSNIIRSISIFCHKILGAVHNNLCGWNSMLKSRFYRTPFLLLNCSASRVLYIKGTDTVYMQLIWRATTAKAVSDRLGLFSHRPAIACFNFAELHQAMNTCHSTTASQQEIRDCPPQKNVSQLFITYK